MYFPYFIVLELGMEHINFVTLNELENNYKRNELYPILAV